MTAQDLCDWCVSHSVATWALQRVDDGPLETQRRCANTRHLDAALETISTGGAAFAARQVCRATRRRPR